MGILDRLKTAAAERAVKSEERNAERTRRAMPGATGLDVEFAVVDVETTGLDPRIDHIVEIGVLVTNPRGEVIDEFCTLVRPPEGFEMIRAAQRVNLIDPEWLKAAPPLEVVLPQVAHRINGRFIVGHNAKFDTEFLEEEFRRTFGWSHDDLGDWISICTLDMCRDIGLPRRLDAVYAELGIRYEKHSALGDCHATFKVLDNFMAKIDPRTFADSRRPDSRSSPTSTRASAGAARAGRGSHDGAPVLEKLINLLAPHERSADRDPEAVDAYLAVLEDAIADAYLSAHEVE